MSASFPIVPSESRSPFARLGRGGGPGIARERVRARRIVAVGGGKGGIGKSLLTANLAIELARKGQRVVAIDADLGGANLHTCLGVGLPKVTLSDLFERRASSLAEIVVPTGIENLSLVSGAQDSLTAANPRHAQKLKLVRNFHSLDADYVLLDLGAGTHFNVLDFFLAANHGILVLVPEPTSIENAYRFIKAAFLRKITALQSSGEVESLIRDALAQRREGTIKTPHDVVSVVKAKDPQAGHRLEEEISRFRPRLVVNQVRAPSDRLMGEAVVAAWHKYFGLEMDYLGAIGYDDEVWKAVRNRRPIIIERPEAETAQAISRIAARILELDRQGGGLSSAR